MSDILKQYEEARYEAAVNGNALTRIQNDERDGDHTVSTSAQLTLGSFDPTNMSFVELDAVISDGLSLVHRNQIELLPLLVEMRDRLHSQGKRTDLPDTPKGLSWQKWVKSKKEVLGSLSTVKRLLAAPKPEPEPKPFWNDFIDRLEALVPTVEDGSEHVIVEKLDTAILRVRQGEQSDPKVVVLCQHIAANFAQYARLLSTTTAHHPDVVNEQEQVCSGVV